MDTRGQHLLLDIWVKGDLSNHVEKIKDYVNNHFTVVNKTNYLFEPQGETIVFILSESHFTLHTYPEHNYLSLDIYICNMTVDMKQVKNDIISLTGSNVYHTALVGRGDPERGIL